MVCATVTLQPAESTLGRSAVCGGVRRNKEVRKFSSVTTAARHAARLAVFKKAEERAA